MQLLDAFSVFDVFSAGPIGPRFSIGALFANSELGGYYPIRPEYLFEDSAGLTPAAVDGVVGLQFDQAQKAALGPELIVNGDFSNGTTGWTLGLSSTVENGELVAIANGSVPDYYNYQALTGPSNRWYQAKAQVTQGSFWSGIWETAPINGYIAGLGTRGVGHHTVLYKTRASGGHSFSFSANSGGSMSGSTNKLDNISVREIQGNHAWQNTTANKPYLRQTPETGKYWLDGDTATAALNVSFPESLGANCTVARVRPGGVEWLEAQTIGTEYNLITPYAYNSDTLIINRALTVSEKAQVERLLRRSVPAPQDFENTLLTQDGQPLVTQDGNYLIPEAA